MACERGGARRVADQDGDSDGDACVSCDMMLQYMVVPGYMIDSGDQA